MDILSEVIKVKEDILKYYQETSEKKEILSKDKLTDFERRLDALRALREATFLISVVEDDLKEQQA